jgi:hypothetical protein
MIVFGSFCMAPSWGVPGGRCRRRRRYHHEFPGETETLKVWWGNNHNSTANWFSIREASHKIATNCVGLTQREADVPAGFPLEVFISVARSLCSRSWNARLHSARVAGLEWSAPCPWRGRSCRETRQQRDGTLLRTRGVLPLGCVRLSFLIFSCWPINFGDYKSGFNSGRIECHSCSIRENRPLLPSAVDKVSTHSCVSISPLHIEE